jgi:hypothetical protein
MPRTGYGRCWNARRTPSPTKTTPVRRCNSPPPRSRWRDQAPARLAASATAALTSVPEMLNSMPSISNCAATLPRAGLANCGKKARKKSATLCHAPTNVPRCSALRYSTAQGCGLESYTRKAG